MMKLNKEYLTRAERWGGLVIVVAMLLLATFFEAHQYGATGFFTSEFRALEMLALYGPIYLSLIAPIVRAVMGRRNPGRLWEALSSLALAVGSYWLWQTFPFDFTHLGDVFPAVLRLPFSWVTDNIGRVLLLVQIILGPITALVNVLMVFICAVVLPDPPLLVF